MADEIIKEEVVEEVETPDVEQEVIDSMKDFDAKIDSDDDSAVEDTPDEDIPEEKAEEEIPAKEVAKEEPAMEEVIDAEIAKIEKQLDVKTEEKVKPEDKVEEKPEEKVEDKPFDCGLDPDEYDEGLIKSVNKLGQDFTEKIKTLESEKAELKNLVNQQNSQRHTEWLDGKINALGDDFVEVYGEGEIEDIEPASEQFENRVKLNARIALTAKAYRNMGKPVPSRNKLFDQAVSYLNKEIVNKSKTEEETIKKLAARKGQVIGRASKKGSATSALEQAAQAMKEFDKKIESD